MFFVLTLFRMLLVSKRIGSQFRDEVGVSSSLLFSDCREATVSGFGWRVDRVPTFGVIGLAVD